VTDLVRPFYFGEQRVIFVDGQTRGYRAGFDLELSHWVPNQTPVEYKKNTSTEICLQFIKSPLPEYENAQIINNHLDVDGLLSVFVLQNPELALRHEEMLVDAAQAGDFNADCKPSSMEFYLALRKGLDCLKVLGVSKEEAFFEGIRFVHRLLNGHRVLEVEADLLWLKNQSFMLKTRVYQGKRLAVFYFPLDLQKRYPDRDCFVIPSFDCGVVRRELLPRYLRNREDLERFKLMAWDLEDGICYQLLVPEYSWAETPDYYNLPGKRSLGVNRFSFDTRLLQEAFQGLQKIEQNSGCWSITSEIQPFSGTEDLKFPAFAGFLNGSSLTPSSISLDQVLDVLTGWETSL